MFKVLAFYKFVPIAQSTLAPLRDEITRAANEMGIYGLLLLGTEGINATIAGELDAMAKFRSFICNIPEFADLEFKESEAKKKPFRRFKVDLRPEIVTLKKDVELPKHSKSHLTPAEWQSVLESGEDVVLLDTRNWYEVAIGKFQGAIDPKIKKFSDLPGYLDEANFPKDKKVLMYCTGGIRCEKAYLEMKGRGYPEVYQLEGGILKYLEQFPNKSFEGECFVFDHRVSVQQDLSPSQRYHLCPHCGDPAETKIQCVRCGTNAIVCENCAKDEHRKTCSKNCAYHQKMGSKNKSQRAAVNG